ncbi:MAG: ethanolamine utilization protein EutP [Lachnospiraceae bacterium]|nr:ethanolamine utilization protein EutP [Lachnospiraceae bacterium]
MKKIIFCGRVGCGKTTLTQVLKGDSLTYNKTQYINHFDIIIDTPGEYAENKILARALILYSFEADVIGLLASATETYTLYSPNIVPLCTRPVVGIVTQIDQPEARPDWAHMWLEDAGCKDIFHISSVTGEGIPDLFDYLREEGDVLPWDNDPAFWEHRKQAKARELAFEKKGFDRLK